MVTSKHVVRSSQENQCISLRSCLMPVSRSLLCSGWSVCDIDDSISITSVLQAIIITFGLQFADSWVNSAALRDLEDMVITFLARNRWPVDSIRRPFRRRLGRRSAICRRSSKLGLNWVLHVSSKKLRRDECTDVCHGSLKRMLIVSILLSCQSERPT